MIRCNNCGTNNIDGSEYCDECGMKLDLVAPPPRARERAEPIYQPPSAVESEPVSSNTLDGPLPTPPSFTTSTTMPKPAMPARGGGGEAAPRNMSGRRGEAGDRPNSDRSNIDRSNMDRSSLSRGGADRRAGEPARPEPLAPKEPGKTFVLSSRGRTGTLDSDQQPAPPEPSNGPRVTARLIIERGGRVGREFSVTGLETNIGRWDADSGIFPDIDLDEDDPEAKISRRHARIINHNGQYFIEDLGSTNGTFVNRGRRLLPGKRHMLQSGDEIIVGKTFLKFQILR
jgi:hypothetical protein